MIHLRSVTKATVDRHSGASLMLRDANASIPFDSRVALLGHSPAELTTLLHLLAGSEKPDSGSVVSGPFRRSPVVNAGPTGGGALVPRLNALENIEFFAQMNGIDAGRLLALVEASCQLGPLLRVQVGKLDSAQRRSLEVALISAVPYDCYFVDKLHILDRGLIWQLLRAARAHHAGLIFTTSRIAKVAQFARIGVVVRNGSIRVFQRLNTAIIVHEQH